MFVQYMNEWQAINKSILKAVFFCLIFTVTDEIIVTEDVGLNISLACNVTAAASWLKNGISITNSDKR